MSRIWDNYGISIIRRLKIQSLEVGSLLDVFNTIRLKLSLYDNERGFACIIEVWTQTYMFDGSTLYCRLSVPIFVINSHTCKSSRELVLRCCLRRYFPVSYVDCVVGILVGHESIAISASVISPEIWWAQLELNKVDHEFQTNTIFLIWQLKIDLALTPCCARVDGECKLPVCAICSMGDETRVKGICGSIVIINVWVGGTVVGVLDSVVGGLIGRNAAGAANSELRYYQGICVDVRGVVGCPGYVIV